MARPTSFLRTVLLVDLVATVASALLLLIGAGALDTILGVSAPVLRGAGLLLVPFAALQAWLVARDQPPAGAVTALIAGNVLWALASVAAVLGLLAPTAIGYGFVLVQAAAVVAIAELQSVGLRRIRAAA